MIQQNQTYVTVNFCGWNVGLGGNFGSLANLSLMSRGIMLVGMNRPRRPKRSKDLTIRRSPDETPAEDIVASWRTKVLSLVSQDIVKLAVSPCPAI